MKKNIGEKLDMSAYLWSYLWFQLRYVKHPSFPDAYYPSKCLMGCDITALREVKVATVTKAEL